MAKDKIPSGTSPISGSSLRNIFRLVKGNRIDKGYRVKFFLSFIVSIILEPFRWAEQLLYNGRIKRFEIKEDPVFILGHWRCGTTFLHNVLCRDPSMGYVTTFQTIYPEMLFSGGIFLKGIMQAVMPKKRPFDNVALGADFPQEEEFAITNTNAMGQSNFWHFPQHWRTIYKRYGELQGLTEKEREHWKSGYRRVIKKALMNTGTKRLMSKNPPNTGRVGVLLEMFPNARFIFIHRDPVTTYVSTKHLVNTLLPVLTFQNISDEAVDENILWQYKELLQGYEKEKSLIQPDNLIEVPYESFEADPMAWTEKIYRQLRLPDYDKVKPLFENYLDSLKSYKKNEYIIPEDVVNKVKQHWGFAFDRVEEKSMTVKP